MKRRQRLMGKDVEEKDGGRGEGRKVKVGEEEMMRRRGGKRRRKEVENS